METAIHPSTSYEPEGEFLRRGEKNLDWTVTTEDGLTHRAGGDVQVLSVGRRGHTTREMRIVNAYFQRVGRDGAHRLAEAAAWNDILEEDSCILAGDFNTHSTIRSSRCENRRATFLENPIRTCELRVLSDGQATRPSEGLHNTYHRPHPGQARGGMFLQGVDDT